ncbi:Down-regulator of transcription 1 [Cyanidiococcus yangmingshanensis]|uniref:Down-regulator of transcription 1 n=1 Tax=Cyanidiococcus yangmingshanensis TaxID=2690220 RepID=A0A7J7IFZ0_9RHOD|nr:Down-regulator of transcription 1 [Cyanidiococcus yangmingshanensis]
MFPAGEHETQGRMAEALTEEAGLPRKTILSWVSTVLQESEQHADVGQRIVFDQATRGSRRAPERNDCSGPEARGETPNATRDAINEEQTPDEDARGLCSKEDDVSSTGNSSFSEDSVASDAEATLLPMVRSLHPDARDLVCACANAFVRHIAIEANRARSDDRRRTIFPKHVLIALERLGLETYVPALEPLIERVEDEQVERQRKKTGRARFEHTGLSMEELKRQQAELLAAAREQTLWP